MTVIHAKHIPAVLLVVVAIHQMTRSQSEHLTSWKGGGFGMFATLDQERFAKIYVSRKGQFFPVAISSSERNARIYRRALALPTSQNAEAFAQLIDEEMKLQKNEQAIAAIFSVDFLQETPRKIQAKPMHMVSSKPEISRGKLVWKW